MILLPLFQIHDISCNIGKIVFVFNSMNRPGRQLQS